MNVAPYRHAITALLAAYERGWQEGAAFGLMLLAAAGVAPGRS